MTGPQRFVVGVGGIALVVALVVAAICALGRSRVEAELSLARSAGAPLTPAALAPPPVAPERNAALRYLEAAKLLRWPDRDSPLGERVSLAIEGRITATATTMPPEGPLVAKEEALTILRDVVADNARPLALLREAAALPEARYDVRYEDGPAMPCDHLMELRKLARLSCAEGRLALLEHRAADAQRSALACLAIAQSVAEEPVLTSRLFAHAIQRWALDLLSAALLAAPPSDEMAAALEAALARFERTSCIRAVQGERVSFLMIFEETRHRDAALDPSGNGTPTDVRYKVGAAIHRHILAGYDEAEGLAVLRDAETRLRRPYPAALDWPEPGPPPRWAIITGASGLDPILRGHAREEATLIARTRLARLALERATGRAAAGGPLPEDPFSGTPMTSRVEGDRELVTSIGRDGPIETGEDVGMWVRAAR